MIRVMEAIRVREAITIQPTPQNPYATPWVGANTPWTYYQGDWFLNGLLYNNFGNQYGWAPYYSYPVTYVVRPATWYAPRYQVWYQQNPQYVRTFEQKYPYYRGHRAGQHYDQRFYNAHHRGQGGGWNQGFHGVRPGATGPGGHTPGATGPAVRGPGTTSDQGAYPWSYRSGRAWSWNHRSWELYSGHYRSWRSYSRSHRPGGERPRNPATRGQTPGATGPAVRGPGTTGPGGYTRGTTGPGSHTPGATGPAVRGPGTPATRGHTPGATGPRASAVLEPPVLAVILPEPPVRPYVDLQPPALAGMPRKPAERPRVSLGKLLLVRKSTRSSSSRHTSSQIALPGRSGIILRGTAKVPRLTTTSLV